MILSKETELRAFLPLKDLEEMKKLLLENEYGFVPDIDYNVEYSAPYALEADLDTDKVTLSAVDMTVTTSAGSHTFTFKRLIHKSEKPSPFFVFINFRPDIPDKYYPLDLIAKSEFNILSFCYNDATSDDGDFGTGVAPILLPNGQENDSTCGKIMLWAWCAMRIMDYASTLDCMDMQNAAVMGHSRLGKTALLTGMLDERFKYVCSNDSGCGGAAVSRGKEGETIADITRVFPFWFCKKFKKYAEAGFAPDFDQHYIPALIAPRYTCIHSATLDLWADPKNELICAKAASKAYENLGLKGLICPDEVPDEGEVCYNDGCIGYFRRVGEHRLEPEDWVKYMEFIRLHIND